MLKLVLVALVFLAAVPAAAADSPTFEPFASDDPAALARTMPATARRLIPVYRTEDRHVYLDTLFRLQMVAGDYAGAITTIQSLRALAGTSSPRLAAQNLQYEIFASAKLGEAARKMPFDEAFRQEFRDTLAAVDNRTSALLIRTLSMVAEAPLRQNMQALMAQQKGKNSLSLTEAAGLVKAYQIVEAFRSFAPLTPELIEADDRHRYLVQTDVPVRTSDGATVCTLIVRPRAGPARLPTLLNFTIYIDPKANFVEARRSASNGYAGVIGRTRGKGCSPDRPSIYEHDGADAADLIDWISRQPWSDGHVGMYGGSYEAVSQWGAAKRMPKALKALMPQSPVGPGVDVPMEGNVLWNFVYPWTFYTTNLKGLDDPTYNDSARWNRLYREWYVSGRAYRDLPKIDGTPNPFWETWISHPSHDAYWQKMIAYQREFARIKIPVLTTAGYFFGGPGASTYYVAEHYKYNPSAEHYLLVGPYDHLRAQRGMVNVFGDITPTLFGYPLDPVALIDMGELRYEWFDYVLKGGPKPALLKDRINYQVMGTNAWKHAPSLKAMAKQKLRFHLSPARAGEAYRLAREAAPKASVTLRVDLADRSDVDRVGPGGNILDTAIDPWNGLIFISDPFQASTEVSGLFSGRLSFIANKWDFDFQIQLYELTPEGKYFLLAPYSSRASHVEDLSRRRLLKPGKRHRFDFSSIRLMSRQFLAGSRLVAVLSIIKSSGQQINYGTGKDVSDETIADAGEPLSIRWFGDSFIDIPVG